MNNNYKNLTTAGIIIFVAAAVFFFVHWKEFFSPPPAVNLSRNTNADIAVLFLKSGNLTKDNPGMKPGIWYLVYAEAGQPASSAELAFQPDAKCFSGNEEKPCSAADLQVGKEVKLSGILEDGIVRVNMAVYSPAPFASPSPIPSPSPTPDKSDLIRVTKPATNEMMKSPLVIQGEARGTWFFEASFPIRILDANGKQLGSAIATTKKNWMTNTFVPFSATLKFSPSLTETGTLVLQKDDPSGLPQNADELKIPVQFTVPQRTVELYYYDAEKDKDANGNIICSEKGLVAIERKIPVSQTPIADTLRLFLKGILTDEEKAQGISTEYPLPGVELQSAILNNGVLTITLSDPQNKTGGGSCRVGVLWKEIEATAKQFTTVKTVKFSPETLFQP